MRWEPTVVPLLAAVAPSAGEPAHALMLPGRKNLEPVQSEKRMLRRAIALAEIVGRAQEAEAARENLDALQGHPRTWRQQRELAERKGASPTAAAAYATARTPTRSALRTASRSIAASVGGM